MDDGNTEQDGYEHGVRAPVAADSTWVPPSNWVRFVEIARVLNHLPFQSPSFTTSNL